MKTVNYLTVLVLATLLMPVTRICQAAAPAQLHLSATIPPFVSLKAIQNVASYSINSADLKRGYLDVPNALTIRLRTNLNTGVPIDVANGSGDARVLVKESGSQDFVGSTFIVPTTGHHANVPINKSYDSRIVLSDDTKEGSYPLVISLSPSI